MMIRRIAWPLVSVSMALAPAAFAPAQADAPPVAAVPGSPDDDAIPLRLVDPTEVNATLGVWVPRLGGNTRLGLAPSARSISLENEFDLDSNEPILALELVVRRHETFELFLSGFNFSTDDTGRFPGASDFGSISLGPGDSYRASFDLTSFNVELSSALWRPYGRPEVRRFNPPRVDYRFTPTLGARFVQAEQTVRDAVGGREVARGTWLIPYGGLAMEMRFRDTGDQVPWLEMLELEGAFGIGPAVGGEGGFMWQVRAGAAWHFNSNVAARFGYRLVEVDAEDEPFDMQAGLQGLYLSFTLRF